MSDFAVGQRVHISQSADNAKGKLGTVSHVGLATCDVQVGSHLMTFLFEDLRVVGNKRESAEPRTQPIQV